MDDVPSIQQHEPLQTDFDDVQGHPTVHREPEYLKLHAAKPKVIPGKSIDHSDDHVAHEDHEDKKDTVVVEPKVIQEDHFVHYDVPVTHIDHEAVEPTIVHHLVPVVPKLDLAEHYNERLHET